MRSKHLVAFLAGSAMALVLASAESTNAAPKNSKASAAKQERVAQNPSNTATDAVNTSNYPPPAADTVAEKVKDVLSSASKGERLFSRKGERQAVDAAYAKRSYAPIWFDQGKPTAKVQAAIDYIKTIAAEGLEPSDYSFPTLTATSLEGQADAELKFTQSILTYARHALNGRVHWSRVTANALYKDNYDAADVLSRISDANDVASVLASFHPQTPAYQKLKSKLAEIRAQKNDRVPVRIPYGQYLKYGNDKSTDKSKRNANSKEKPKFTDEPVAMLSDPRVPLLREKLGLPAKSDTNYDKELAEAVAKFQDVNGLKPDGQVGNPTIDALNGPGRETQTNAVLATMERWRWVQRELGKTHVVLNIPDFHLRVYNDSSMIWMTRVVVGKPSQATPVLTETMKFITVNPVWNVPQSIVYNELLPIYESSDPGVFAKQGLKVEQGRDGIRVYQPPGDRNALGRLRFNFPNKFLVYQHDTSEKHYFGHERRAYSHGCMRVQDPVKYAEVLLSYAVPAEKYSQDRIRKMYSDSEVNIEFKVQIPVHITYQTAFVDDNGNLQFRDDVYGLDTKYVNIMKGSERRIADVQIDRPADPNYRPTPTDFARLENVPRDNDGGYGGRRGGGGQDPFSFFGRMFR
jgi:L,D-transpeptidase YcbB